MKNVNRGRLELRTFDPDRDLAAAEAVATAVKAGQDPFAGRTGDIRRHYRLDAANEILPYRTYMPTSYTGAKAFPLIIALHGLGGTEDAFFDNYEKKLPPLAESHGYIVAAPLGYRVDGSYGWGLGNPPADPNTKRTQDFSEQDVMQVLARVRQLYKIDDSRIYLMGHSMGAIGTWKTGAEVSRRLRGDRDLRRQRRAGNARADRARCPNSSCTATPIRPSTSPARARWSRS